MSARIIVADVLVGLAQLAPESVQCVVTSPPYWGLRDYGVAGQIGLEATPEEYLDMMVRVFHAVRATVKPDGVLWLNLGDSYANDGKWGGETGGKQAYLDDSTRRRNGRARRVTGLKPKDLIGMPWMVAFALRSAGWWLRSEIIWSKPNPMPESTTDRPTKAHEHLFLLAKSARYYYDAEAIAEPRASMGDAPVNGWASGPGSHHPVDHARDKGDAATFRGGGKYTNGQAATAEPVERESHGNEATERTTRNRRTVWTIATQPFAEAHFATFPEDLVEPCILGGSRRGDTVLDPFAGSGTVGVVADRLGRDFVGVELNPAYAAMAERRIRGDSPLFADVHLTGGDPS